LQKKFGWGQCLAQFPDFKSFWEHCILIYIIASIVEPAMSADLVCTCTDSNIMRSWQGQILGGLDHTRWEAKSVGSDPDQHTCIKNKQSHSGSEEDRGAGCKWRVAYLVTLMHYGSETNRTTHNDVDPAAYKPLVRSETELTPAVCAAL
jgi:hypothetical protein